MIFDAHSHWLPGDIIENAHFFSKAWGDIESQVRAMDEAGVDRAVISYPTTDAHLAMGGLERIVEIYNECLSRLLKDYSGRLIGAALLPFDKGPVMLDVFKKATQELGFKAISMPTSFEGVFLDDERFWPLYRQAQRVGVPIFVHAQIVNPIGSERVKDPLLTPVIEYVFETTMCVGKLLMNEVFKKFPDLKFIFSYFGGVTPFIAHRYDATYTMLRGINFVKDLKMLPSDYLKNIYVDTGGDSTTANFMSSFELLGHERVLWGSDYPAKRRMDKSFQVFDELGLNEEKKKAVLGGNLERIFQEVKL